MTEIQRFLLSQSVSILGKQLPNPHSSKPQILSSPRPRISVPPDYVSLDHQMDRSSVTDGSPVVREEEKTPEIVYHCYYHH